MPHNANLVWQLVVRDPGAGRWRGKEKCCGAVVVLDTGIHHSIANVRARVSPVSQHALGHHHSDTLTQMTPEAAEEHLPNLLPNKAYYAGLVAPHLPDKTRHPVELLLQRELLAASRGPVREVS